jgi:tetratricopeptide (TPR) repeat protein
VRERLGRLKAELETLYRSAGEPTEEGLAKAVKSHPHGGSVTVSTISAWLRGQYAPLPEYTGRFIALVDVLKEKADGAPAYRPLTAGKWGELLKAAQEESKARQRSGPGRKRTAPQADGHTGPVRLPADVAGFSGRAALLEALRDWLTPSAGQTSPVVSVVAGMPGAGKTALAIRASHQAQEAGWFPGGIVFEDLRGFSTDEPVEHGTAAARLLGALGARQQDVPLTPPERALALQALLGRLKSQQRPVLIVLDNAATAGQVRPLLPSSPHRMIITSRHTLSVVARQFEVPPLSPDEALDLLDGALQGRHPGDDRIAREPADARYLARLCGHLPLALQIVAALLSDEQDLPVAEQARELADISTRLERLHRDDLAVRAAIDLSYEHGHLTPDQARAFRLLAMIPGPDASTPAAAAMLGLAEDDARSLLRGLHRAHLLDKNTRSRWIMHDLIRIYARERAGERVADDRPDASLDGLFAYYRKSVHAADLWLRLPRAVIQKAQPERFESRDQASAWLDDEALSLVAAISAAHDSGRWIDAHALAARLGNGYFEARYRFEDWVTTGLLGLKAARHIGREEIFVAAANMGSAYRLAGQYDQAVSHLKLALSMAPDERNRSPVLHNLGLSYFRLGKFGKAERLHRHDLEICYQLKDGRGAAQAAVALGDALRGQKRFPEAAEVLEVAIGMLQYLGEVGFGDPVALANARQNLALTYLGGDPLHTAVRIIWQLSNALALARDHANEKARATIYLNLSAAYRSKCAVTYGSSSLEWAQQALQMFRRLGDREGEAHALTSVGATEALTGDLPAARRHLSQAREILERHGTASDGNLAGKMLARVPHMPPPAAECTECQRETEPFRSWLEDLPHAVLRGNDSRLQEFSEVTSVRWSQAPPHAD